LDVVRTIGVGVGIDVGSCAVFIPTRAPITLIRSTLSAVVAAVVVPAVTHEPVSAGGIASAPDPLGGATIGGVVVSDVAVTVDGICGLTIGVPEPEVGVPPDPSLDATVPVLPGVSVFDCAAPDRPVGPIAMTL
jgi:hypothetical protein